MQLQSQHEFLKIAHRGYSELYPENSMVSFEEAVKAGAKMIELDVQLSKDRKPFVLHDATLDRTTSHKGLAEGCNLQKLVTIQIGYEKKLQGQFPKTSIPSLEQVLNKFGDTIYINVEIKPDAYEEEEKSDNIEYQVIDLICSFGLQESVVISCFQPKSLLRIARRDPSLHLSLLVEEPFQDTHLNYLKEINAFSYNPEKSLLNKEIVAKVQKMGFRVYPYTINNQAELQRVEKLGVDGCFINDPTLSS